MHWFEPNKKRIREHLGNCLMLVTVLNPHFGFEKPAKLSLAAHHEDTTLREAAVAPGFGIGELFDAWTYPLGENR